MMEFLLPLSLPCSKCGEPIFEDFKVDEKTGYPLCKKCEGMG